MRFSLWQKAGARDVTFGDAELMKSPGIRVSTFLELIRKRRPATDGLIQASATAKIQREAAGPQPSFAISRSLNFWILPVDVFGSSVNTTWRGHL